MDTHARRRSNPGPATSTRQRWRTRARAIRVVAKYGLARAKMAPVIALVGATCLCVAWPAHAQDVHVGEGDARPAVSAKQIESVVATLRDDTEREKLIQQLEVLLAAKRAEAADTESAASAGFGGMVLEYLSHRLEALNSLAGGAVSGLANLPAVVGELAGRASDPDVRAAWVDLAFKLILVVGAGLIAERLVMRLLREPLLRLQDREEDGTGRRTVRLIRRTLMDLGPLAAFAVASYAVLVLSAPHPRTRVIALVIINAHVIVRAVSVLARVVLRPRYSGLRFVQLTDENANYLFFWIRRLTIVLVYGIFVAESLPLLGLGQAHQAFAKHLIALVVTSMLIVLVLQNRQVVSRWLSSTPSKGTWRRMRRSLAGVWHVVVIAYILATYGVWIVGVAGGFEFLLRATVVTLITGFAAFAVLHGLRSAVERGFRVNEETRRRFPHLEKRVNRHRGIIDITLRSIVVLVAALLVLEAWHVGPFTWLASESGRTFVGHLLTVAFITGGALVAWELLSMLVERLLEERDQQGEIVQRGARMRTFLPLVRNVVRIVLLVLVLLVVLSELGIAIGPLLAGAGVVGLAISFGAQSLVKDVISGFFVLLEDTISVGDVVDLGGHAGVVESMSIRSVRLRDVGGNVHTVPFGEVASVLNMTKDYSYALMEVGIAYNEDVDAVVEVLREIGVDMQADEVFGPVILEPLDVLGLQSFGDSSVNIRIRLKTVPTRQWAVKREFQRRMKRAFDERGIEIPFPHQTLYFGVDKSGAAPAARIVLDNGPDSRASSAPSFPRERE